MAAIAGGPLFLTDADVDGLAVDFLNSPFADDISPDWSLDRRLDGFLRHRCLVPLIDDVSAYDLVRDRVMSYLGAVHGRG
ncbi:hypothetical protein BN971_03449 [Mycobacterium bohemicum DSM 44277]|jgi:hypothetical protein|uniref:Uncharacterized protein n=2 Tax=Mycobacterium bohemicum TaxID=56425 RepID=A0A1X1R4Z4_MYCBE|nr:hypothetical protein [Mycobacterium bohemicum]MCV6968127.1 hypothetical protein [Mycobacterium bohemicum]ORU99422.1 hypothetical protein AWB93_11150 [Mycobacterium bohemicum]CPR12155.1 hypothetical protein BN971_03449 [Mycobacterium bohemicum DSM 44277]